MSNKIVWIDERTSDYIGRSWDFKPIIEKLGANLITCGEGKSRAIDRGTTCIKSFIDYLQQAKSQGTVSEIAGFIIDVNIPVVDLGLVGNNLIRIKTKNGAYTGFTLARYILGNDKKLSPFEDLYKNIPILFLSISQYDPGTTYTKWMEKHYLNFSDSEEFTLFTHLEKKFQEQHIRNSVVKWVEFAMKYDKDKEHSINR